MKFESFQNIFVFLGCIVMLCISGWLVLDVESEKHLIASFKEVHGYVISCDDQVRVSHRHRHRRESHSYKCIYQYEVSGRYYTAEQIVPTSEISSSMTMPRTGGAVVVYYKPSNPQVSRVFVRKVPTVAIVVMWICIVGVWLACPFKDKAIGYFRGKVHAMHPLVFFVVYIFALMLLAKLLVMSGWEPCSRVDPETGDVWGP